MMRRFWLTFVVGNLFVALAWSQLDAQFSQYFSVMNYHNPAFAGKSGDLNVTALYQMPWLGLPNGPKTALATAETPWKVGKRDHGFGVVAVLDTKSSLYSTTNFLLQYAYIKKMGKGTLRIGLQGGLVQESFQGDSAHTSPTGGSTVHEPDDDIIPQSKVTASGLDFGVGLLYYTNQYYLGLGCTHLLGTKLQLDEYAEVVLSRSFNLTGGYNIQLSNPLLELQPSVFVQTNLQMYTMDITGRVVYNKMIHGGLGTRLSDQGRFNAAILYLGVHIKRFRVGYAYEFPTSALSKASVGGHELMASYRMQINKPKGNRNKHKSIRIL